MSTRRDFLKHSAAVAALGVAQVPAQAARRMAPKPAIAEAVAPLEQPFALAQVELLDGPFLQARDRDRGYLMSVPNDRLLHCFRVTAGLASTAQPLGGWESPGCELRGHFAGGHYLSACALMYASTGDEALRSKADGLVAGLARCQRADGYLGAYPSSFYDRLGRGEDVWVPLYTAHKLLAGQLDMARLCSNAQAAEVAARFADWIGTWMDSFDDAQWQRILNVEFGGINESFWELYRISGQQRYQRWARRFDQATLLDPLAEGRDVLDGLHANTQLPKIVAAARAYEIDGDARQRRIAESFWNIVTHHHAYATGGISDYEHFGQPDHLAGRLSGHSHECCCSYNLLKLTRHLYGWQPQAALMDYYERVLFNARLGTQDEAGMMMYFVPMDAGYWKLFNTPFNSFWCCTGTGAEDFAKTQDSIYFHNQAGLSVNLYIASRLNLPEQGLRLTQQTRFPDEQGSTLLFELRQPHEFELRLRIPAWVQPGWEVAVNGQRQTTTVEPGNYVHLHRTWRNGDQVTLHLPMALQAAPLPDEPSLQAMRYGPLVLAVCMGTDGIPPEQLHVSDQRPSFNKIIGRQIPTAYQPPKGDWTVATNAQAMEFQADGIQGPLQLVPLNRILHERYSVYCRVRPQWEKNPQF